MRYRHLYIVDDDREGGESLKMVLQLRGYRVAHAHDLKTALAEAAGLAPQLVLMDIAMPNADGFEGQEIA